MESKKEMFLDFTTLSTLQENGDICCPNCGSWTTIEDLITDNNCPGNTYCPLCCQ